METSLIIDDIERSWFGDIFVPANRRWVDPIKFSQFNREPESRWREFNVWWFPLAGTLILRIYAYTGFFFVDLDVLTRMSIPSLGILNVRRTTETNALCGIMWQSIACGGVSFTNRQPTANCKRLPEELLVSNVEWYTIHPYSKQRPACPELSIPWELVLGGVVFLGKRHAIPH